MQRVGGRVVADVWGGHVHAERTRPWRHDTLVNERARQRPRVAALYDAHLRGGVPRAGSGDRVRVAGAALRAEAAEIVSDGLDRVLSRHSRFALGFQLPQPTRAIGPSPNAYGHFGYGGSLGMADPDASLAFAFVTNRPGDRWQTPRTQRLLGAVYTCL